MNRNKKCIFIDEHVKKFLSSLRFLRKSAGKTLKELAAEIGTTFHSIHDWEHGRAYPSLMNLIRLAEVFDYDISESLNYKYFYKTIKPVNTQKIMRHYGLNYLELEHITGYNRERVRSSILMNDYGTVQCLAAVLDVLEQERKLAEFRKKLI